MDTKYVIHENQTRQTTFSCISTDEFVHSDEYENINSYASSP